MDPLNKLDDYEVEKLKEFTNLGDLYVESLINKIIKSFEQVKRGELCFPLKISLMDKHENIREKVIDKLKKLKYVAYLNFSRDKYYIKIDLPTKPFLEGLKEDFFSLFNFKSKEPTVYVENSFDLV